MDWTYMAQGKDKLLWTWQWTFRFHKMQGISWLSECVLASEDGISFVDLVSWFVIEIIVVENVGTITFPLEFLALKI